MKLSNKNLLALSALALVLGLASCKDAEYSALKGQAYIAQTGTASGSKLSTLSVADGETVSADLNVRVSDVVPQDTEYELVVDEAVMNSYNERYGTTYKVLPEALRTLSTQTVVVKAGASISEPVNLTVQALTKELKDSGDKFAIPFRLRAKTAGAAILPGADEYIYAINPVLINHVPVLGTDTFDGIYRKAKAEGGTAHVMDAWTVEFRVNMSGYRKNNQALFGSWGPSSEIYVRFGDAPTPFNTLQVKFAGTQFDKSNTIFTPNTWYHVAVVYNGTTLALYVNGQKDLDTDKVAGKVFTLGEVLHVAGSGATWFVDAMMMQEMRVWGVARTPAQLIENEHSVNPTTQGLLHYWKMNDGPGASKFANSVAGAPAMVVSNSGDTEIAPRWLDNVRSDGKGRTNFN